MDILPRVTESLDVILLNCQKFAKEFISQRLEIEDRKLYLWTKNDPNKRFVLIRKDSRTILTSSGIIRYKRRYYYDKYEKNYVYLLDNQLEIPSHARMSNELILKILDLASIMTYKEVGKHLSNEFELSKYTIWKTIKDSYVECSFSTEINRNGAKVHVQIDEKFINMSTKKKRKDKLANKNKKRYYTLTIFAGKHKINKTSYELENKTVISSSSLPTLKKRLMYLLVNRYKVTMDEEIFISGDLAQYIQRLGEDISICRTKYVPDKYHVYSAIRKEIPGILIDDYSINDKSYQNYLIKNLSDNKDNVDSRKVRRLLLRNPDVFKSYLDKEYLGCSQEGQNSHIYAPRFGKYANRFHPRTIEKLSLIREAIATNNKIIIGSNKRDIPKKLDIGYIIIDLDGPLKYVLDTSEMKYESRKMFDAIKYGNN